MPMFLAAGAVEFAHEGGEGFHGFRADGVVKRDAHPADGAVARRADQSGRGGFSGELLLDGAVSIEKKFATEAAAARLVGTPGHRSVGGMRVSLYNAVTLEAVETLTSFMREFQRARG